MDGLLKCLHTLTCWCLVWSCTSLNAQELLVEADKVFEQRDMDGLKRSGQLYATYLKANPESYEAAWKASRSYREYAQLAKEKGVDGIEDLCKEYGKLGMELGEKAIQLEPKSVEGHFYYGLSVGIYSDGVSIVTALREGLKDKTKEKLEKAYEIDKTFHDGGPMKALGRYWYVLPWPFTDTKSSLKYLREAHKEYPDDAEAQVYLAETLIKSKETKEAKSLLEKASKSERSYYADWAKRLLKGM